MRANIKIARATVHYHESIYDQVFIYRQEKINYDLLKLNGIEPTGYFHYDEQFPKITGEQMVGLTAIDAINNLPINEILIEKKLISIKIL